MPQEVGRRKAKEVGAELGKHGKLLVKRLKRKQRGGPQGQETKFGSPQDKWKGINSPTNNSHKTVGHNQSH